MLRYEVHVKGQCAEENPFFPLPIEEYDDIWPLIEPSFPLKAIEASLHLERIEPSESKAYIRFWGSKTIELPLDQEVHFKSDLGDKKFIELFLTMRAYECGEMVYKKGFFLRVDEDYEHIEGYEKDFFQKSYDLEIRLWNCLYLEHSKQYVTIVGIFPKYEKITVKIGPKRGQGKAYTVTEDEPGGYRYEDSGGAYESYLYTRQIIAVALMEEWLRDRASANPSPS